MPDQTLIAVAVADALGAATEFKDPGEVIRRWPGGFTTFQSGSPFNIQPGDATDDTQMTLATLLALRDLPGDAPLADLARAVRGAYVAWMSSAPPDAGYQTRQALRGADVAGGTRTWLASGGRSAGNGALMRAAAPFIAGLHGETLLRVTAVTSALTHADPRCVLSSVLLAALLERAGQPYAQAVQDALTASVTYLRGPAWTDLDRAALLPGDVRRALHAAWPDAADRAESEVTAAAHAALRGTLTDTSGYTVTTLQNALVTGGADTYFQVVMTHVRRGGDSDTIAAVAGAIAGARGLPVPEDLAATVRAGHTWPGWPHTGPLRAHLTDLRRSGA